MAATELRLVGNRELLKQYKEFGDTFSESHVCSQDLLPDLKVQKHVLDLKRIINRM